MSNIIDFQKFKDSKNGSTQSAEFTNFGNGWERGMRKHRKPERSYQELLALNPYHPFKFMKRSGIYKKNANCYFDPKTETAWSYDWWCFVIRIDGKLIFNPYHYSSSTSKHQSSMRGLLKRLHKKIHYEVESPRGFQNGFIESYDHYKSQYDSIREAMLAPRSHKRKNAERAKDLVKLQETMKLCKELHKAWSKQERRGVK